MSNVLEEPQIVAEARSPEGVELVLGVDRICGGVFCQWNRINDSCDASKRDHGVWKRRLSSCDCVGGSE